MARDGTEPPACVDGGGAAVPGGGDCHHARRPLDAVDCGGPLRSVWQHRLCRGSEWGVWKTTNAVSNNECITIGEGRSVTVGGAQEITVGGIRAAALAKMGLSAAGAEQFAGGRAVTDARDRRRLVELVYETLAKSAGRTPSPWGL